MDDIACIATPMKNVVNILIAFNINILFLMGVNYNYFSISIFFYPH